MRYLITSALPYINGVKHLGNLIGSMLPADVYARYLRARERDVLFLCGTDEHGTPAELAALNSGLPVSEYCRQMHARQADLCRRFSLSFDHFGRSSSPQNHDLTRQFARTLIEKGLLEERVTHQFYSASDRRFLPDRYVVGTCPHCGYARARGDQCESCTRLLDPAELVEPRSAISGSRDLVIQDSQHLFLLLTRLQDSIREWVERQSSWPLLTRSIALKWLNEGLQDRCITRDLEWGIPVPLTGYEGKVFYVWFDAPIEYIGATKEWADALAGRDWRSWWFDTADVRYVQFMAKDNVPFHTIMFPATILGSREPWKLPDYIKAFHWLTYYGGKFSTSSGRGVFMDAALDLLPADYWRYFLLSAAPETVDSDFTWEAFGSTTNKDLVGVYGNFVNRVIAFTVANYDQRVPAGGGWSALEAELEEELGPCLTRLEAALESLEFRKAMRELRGIWTLGNTYLAKAAPWKQITEAPSDAARTVRIGLNLVRIIAILTEPFLPESSQRVFDALHLEPGERLWPRELAAELEVLGPERRIDAPGHLFRRLSPDEIQAWATRFQGAATPARRLR
jgi:methionyl-tRNA synthetase